MSPEFPPEFRSIAARRSKRLTSRLQRPTVVLAFCCCALVAACSDDDGHASDATASSPQSAQLAQPAQDGAPAGQSASAFNVSPTTIVTTPAPASSQADGAAASESLAPPVIHTVD